MALFAAVAVGLRLDRELTYAVPPEFRALVGPGVRVLVPLGSRTVTGYVIKTLDEPAYGGTVRPLADVLDRRPTFTPELLGFLQWAAGYYLLPLGELMRKALPPSLHSAEKVRLRATPSGKEACAAPGQSDPLLERLAAAGEVSLRRGLEMVGDAGVRRLVEAGLVERVSRVEAGGSQGEFRVVVRIARYDEAVLSGPKQRQIADVVRLKGEVPMEELKALSPSAATIVKTLVERGVVVTDRVRVYRRIEAGMQVAPGPERLTPAQDAAVARIIDAAAAGAFKSFLLHGVTGSGKTEVYLRAAAAVLAAGRSVLILVPEIALTPQLMARFEIRFPGQVAVLHSALTPRDRLDQWCLAAEGMRPVVLGARSAIFAPLSRVGLIVVDEEHEPSFKQEEHPFYNARDLALVRGKRNDCPVVLGSATPSLESYRNVSPGRLECLELPDRVTRRPLPDVAIVDLRKAGFADRHKVFSRPLADALRENQESGGQTILFLNRRGFAAFLLCEVCGHVPLCPNCAISLTYYKRSDVLRCHYCQYAAPRPRACPACGKESLGNVGYGTERVVDALAEIAPGARVEQLDATVSASGRLAEVLERVRRGETDILVGTQVVAKGHDFPGVTLVGVLLADLGLSFPDFRASERTFQLLTQVAGRSGRGDRAGQVLIQTYLPNHFALQCAQRHDFKAFAIAEMGERRMRRFPPFTCLSLLKLKGKDFERVQAAARTAAKVLKGQAPDAVQILGPTLAPLSLVGGLHRFQVLLRTGSRGGMQEFLKKAAPALANALGHGGAVRWEFDVDPINLM